MPHTLLAGHGGGNGGHGYFDEFNAYRSWLTATLSRNEAYYQKKFSYSADELNNALKTMKEAKFFLKSEPDAEIELGGMKRKLSEVLPKPMKELFIIDGEQKDAINIWLKELPVIIVDTEAWDQLDGKLDRKRALMAHEFYGLVGLEGTGDIRFSKEFLDQNASLNQVVTKSGLQVVPLWNQKYRDEFLIGENESCDLEAGRRLPATIGKLCKAAIGGTANPDGYFAFECAFDGAIATVWKTQVKTIHYEFKGHIPGIYNSYSSRDLTSSYYQDSKIILKMIRASERQGSNWIPGYDFEEKITIHIPVDKKFCRVRGSVFLTGIDPLGDTSKAPELLKSSEGTWDEAMSETWENPTERMLNACFLYRQQIRKPLFDKSHCRLIELPDKRWRWELWAVHPFASAYPWQD